MSDSWTNTFPLNYARNSVQLPRDLQRRSLSSPKGDRERKEERERKKGKRREREREEKEERIERKKERKREREREKRRLLRFCG